MEISMKRLNWLSWLAVVIFIFGLTSVSWAMESDVDKLLQLLIKKGVISEQDAAEFRADLAVSKQEEKEKQKEFNITAGKPVKISGYTQLRYQSLQEDGKNDSFDIRRSRLDIKGNLTPQFDYEFQGEWAGSSPKLLDAVLGYTISPELRFSGGQIKLPFSLENVTSDAKMETINRSQIVEALAARKKDVIGDQNGRDIGVQASGSLFKSGDRAIVDYAIGVFDGAGINATDNNDQKDLAGRIVVHPIPGLDVGGSFYHGDDRWGNNSTSNQTRDRVGAEFAYYYKSLDLKGEYIRGKDGSTKKDGWYLLAGYYVIPNVVQGVVKYDSFDPDRNKDDNRTNVTTLGLNWNVNKWALLQLDYEFKTEQGTAIDNNVLSSQLTLQF
jgi:phosphate-selective porin OprO/OprP